MEWKVEKSLHIKEKQSINQSKTIGGFGTLENNLYKM